MNFSLLTDKNEDVAAGRCVVLSEPGSRDYLYISAIYVEGNTNKPTKSHPNRFVGLGQLLLFSAIKYGMEQNIENASLLPVDDSQGFYLKMGFHPTIYHGYSEQDGGHRGAAQFGSWEIKCKMARPFLQCLLPEPGFSRPQLVRKYSQYSLKFTA